MRLYNTRTLKIEEFKPLVEGEVSMYVCGPTVYNHIHIGNARPIIVFDTLRRVFEAEGYKVKYVSNYTDVDDKIINKAIEEHKHEAEITEEYIQAYNEVRHKLNAHDLYKTPRVTETMDEIIKFIDELIETGHAYEVDGDVFFRVNSVESYGEISHQNIDDLQVGARIEENDKKESPLDFALWKKTDMGIKWNTKWGDGRPGWHTECVVMINKEFGKDLIDIHGGGMDLRFPHHENEVAQCRALHNTTLANFWLHNGMINIDGVKMSKSLGNFTLAKDVLKQFSPQLVRWLMLSVHYRMELNFSDEVFETAQKELDKVLTPLKQATVKLALANETIKEGLDKELVQQFLDAMDDDLNTPNAYAVIFETVKKLNQVLRVKDIDAYEVSKYINTVEKMLDVLGIEYHRISLTEEDKNLFAMWNSAKQEKNFDEADKVRNQLIERGLL
ncbi:cysteine--tRNA ligase [Anaerorhabdus furcosa]|uniref:Cysteine--tRNA ligase n=1 Tax=Anaerorhabdus furcosa TaxID=118967 RepID=A0A1T4KIW6_9FIRM|nr:cysteine--tRNA ligase [Anaerorhabdus furcosa]SJZ42327.1 cysteinyl-tRNA synthetase [Anaerorhabdus furcosa]